MKKMRSNYSLSDTECSSLRSIGGRFFAFLDEEWANRIVRWNSKKIFMQ
jgi:hypothetical protein